MKFVDAFLYFVLGFSISGALWQHQVSKWETLQEITAQDQRANWDLYMQCTNKKHE